LFLHQLFPKLRQLALEGFDDGANEFLLLGRALGALGLERVRDHLFKVAALSRARPLVQEAFRVVLQQSDVLRQLN